MRIDLFDADVNFNPRSHEGSDLDGSVGDSKIIAISIHAPMKGATVWM